MAHTVTRARCRKAPHSALAGGRTCDCEHRAKNGRTRGHERCIAWSARTVIAGTPGARPEAGPPPPVGPEAGLPAAGHRAPRRPEAGDPLAGRPVATGLLHQQARASVIGGGVARHRRGIDIHRRRAGALELVRACPGSGGGREEQREEGDEGSHHEHVADACARRRCSRERMSCCYRKSLECAA